MVIRPSFWEMPGNGKFRRLCKGLILLLSFCLVSPVSAAGRDITLQWGESIDSPYLQSYVIYYYTTAGDADSLNAADYAVSYTLAGGSPVTLVPASDPKPITIDKNNT